MLRFSFWLNFIMQLLIYKYKKENLKIPSENEEIIIFFLNAQSGDEANLYSCCCFKHGHFKSKCHKLHNFQLLLVSVQSTAQKSFRIFLETGIILGGAKFSSHDSGSHFLKVDF